MKTKEELTEIVTKALGKKLSLLSEERKEEDLTIEYCFIRNAVFDNETGILEQCDGFMIINTCTGWSLEEDDDSEEKEDQPFSVQIDLTTGLGCNDLSKVVRQFNIPKNKYSKKAIRQIKKTFGYTNHIDIYGNNVTYTFDFMIKERRKFYGPQKK